MPKKKRLSGKRCRKKKRIVRTRFFRKEKNSLIWSMIFTNTIGTIQYQIQLLSNLSAWIKKILKNISRMYLISSVISKFKQKWSLMEIKERRLNYLTGYIYKIENRRTNDEYIGQTRQKYPIARFYQHLYESISNGGKHQHCTIYKHLRKYSKTKNGIDNLQFSIIEKIECNSIEELKKELNIKEKYYIQLNQPSLNEQYIISKSIINPNKDKIKLVCYLKNGNFYKNYRSITEASNDLHICSASISGNLRGISKCNKYIFKYVNEAPPYVQLKNDTRDQNNKRNKKCPICGQIFECNSNRQIYCKECKKTTIREQSKLRQRKIRSKQNMGEI